MLALLKIEENEMLSEINTFWVSVIKPVLLMIVLVSILVYFVFYLLGSTEGNIINAAIELLGKLIRKLPK